MLGMGGIFLTPVLILTLDLPISVAMGTALITFIGTGLLGSYIYHRQGSINWPAALLLGCASIIGALFGSQLNLALSQTWLEIILAVFLAVMGIFTIFKDRLVAQGMDWQLELEGRFGKLIFFTLGISVGLASGLLGVGGPVLLVPILIFLGWPMLVAVGVSQVVSVFAALAGTVGYLVNGRIELLVAALALTGELLGVFSGGYLAHRLDGKKLKLILGSALVGLSVYFV